jgi:hypothetical protein
MKVNLYKNRNVFVAVCNAIGKEHDLVNKIIEARDPDLKDGADAIDEIVFTVNGIELDFNNFINGFATEWNKQVEKCAIELINQKYNGLLDSIYSIQEELDYQKDRIERN